VEEGASAVDAFDAHADSLDVALTMFRGAAESVAMRAPSCTDYLRSYDLATSHFAAMSALYRTGDPSIDFARSMRFNKLASDVGDMDRDYRRSRCRRR
jgi:hypothetical protein